MSQGKIAGRSALSRVLRNDVTHVVGGIAGVGAAGAGIQHQRGKKDEASTIRRATAGALLGQGAYQGAGYIDNAFKARHRAKFNAAMNPPKRDNQSMPDKAERRAYEERQMQAKAQRKKVAQDLAEHRTKYPLKHDQYRHLPAELGGRRADRVFGYTHGGKIGTATNVGVTGLGALVLANRGRKQDVTKARGKGRAERTGPHVVELTPEQEAERARVRAERDAKRATAQSHGPAPSRPNTPRTPERSVPVSGRGGRGLIGLARRNARDAVLPGAVLGSAAVGSAVRDKDKRQTLGTVAAGGAGLGAWHAGGQAIRRAGNKRVGKPVEGISRSQLDTAESKWRRKHSVAGDNPAQARERLSTNYQAMRDYPTQSQASRYKRVLGHMSGKRGALMQAGAIGVPALVANRALEPVRKDLKDPQAAYAAAKAKGFPGSFEDFQAKASRPAQRPAPAPKPAAATTAAAPAKPPFRLPKSWITSGIGAGIAVAGTRRVTGRKERTAAKDRRTDAAIGAAAGAGGSNAAYQLGGKWAKYKIEDYRNKHATDEHKKIWNRHLKESGARNTAGLNKMPFEARRKVYANYPMEIPGARAQRILAWKNKRSVGVGTSVVGGGIGAAMAGRRKDGVGKRLDSRDERAYKLRRHDQVQAGVGSAGAVLGFLSAKGKRPSEKLLRALPGAAAAGQAAYDLRQDAYGWSPQTHRVRRGYAEPATKIGKSRTYGYMDRERNYPRTAELAAGGALAAWGVPRLKLLSPLAAHGLRLATKHGGGKEAEAALQAARSVSRVTRNVTGAGEAQLRRIKALDTAIEAVPAHLRPGVATAAGALLAARAIPTHDERFVPTGRF